MIVILEGPDGAGKTTLAEAVRLRTGWEYHHASAPTTDALVEYTAALADRTKSYILDRWHLGEEVYGPLHRHRSGLTPDQLVAVEQFLDSRGAIVVYCSGFYNELDQNLRKRGDMPHGTLRHEMSLWDKQIKKTWLPVYKSPVRLPMTADEVIAAAKARWETVTNAPTGT